MTSFDQLWESYLEESFESKIISKLQNKQPTNIEDIIKLLNKKDHLKVRKTKSGYMVINPNSPSDTSFSFHRPHGKDITDGGTLKNILNMIRGNRIGG